MVDGLRLLRLGRLLVVGLDVKVDEEEEVAGEDAAAKERCAFGAGAGTHRRHMRPVGRGEVRVSWEQIRFQNLRWYERGCATYCQSKR